MISCFYLFSIRLLFFRTGPKTVEGIRKTGLAVFLEIIVTVIVTLVLF